MFAKRFLGTLVFVLSLVPSLTFAATLGVSPATNTYTVGDRATITVYVSSDTSVNAVSGVLKIPTDIFSVVSVSKSSSFLSFWVTDPVYHDSDGSIHFEGVSPGAGYSGSHGTVITVTLRAKQPGTGVFSFDGTSQVLANDGNGTDILAASPGASLSVVSAASQSTPTDTAASSADTQTSDASQGSSSDATVGAPVITSSTHPTADSWYSLSTGLFSWNLPSNVTAVRTILSVHNNATPSIVFAPPINERTLDNIPDGTTYLAVQFKTANGWGAIARRAIHVDTVSPTVSLREIARQDPTDPHVQIGISGNDAGSGIGSYVITIDGGAAITIPGTSTIYTTTALAPGTHTVEVKAVDLAGNTGSATLSVSNTALLSPTLALDTVTTNGVNTQVVRGTSGYPSAFATIYFEDNLTTALRVVAPTDEKGNFIAPIPQDLRQGIYHVRAVVNDIRGAQSTATDPLTLTVWGSWFTFSTDALMYVGIAAALLLVLGSIGFFIWHLFFGFRKLVSVRVSEMREVLHDQFEELKSVIGEEIAALENIKTQRALTVEEERFMKRFTHLLDKSEQAIEKTISKVERNGR